MSPLVSAFKRKANPRFSLTIVTVLSASYLRITSSKQMTTLNVNLQNFRDSQSKVFAQQLPINGTDPTSFTKIAQLIIAELTLSSFVGILLGDCSSFFFSALKFNKVKTACSQIIKTKRWTGISCLLMKNSTPTLIMYCIRGQVLMQTSAGSDHVLA